MALYSSTVQSAASEVMNGRQLECSEVWQTSAESSIMLHTEWARYTKCATKVLQNCSIHSRTPIRRSRSSCTHFIYGDLRLFWPLPCTMLSPITGRCP